MSVDHIWEVRNGVILLKYYHPELSEIDKGEWQLFKDK